MVLLDVIEKTRSKVVVEEKKTKWFDALFLWEKFKNHLAETTGMLTVALPLHALVQTQFGGVRHLSSLYEREVMVIAAFLGINKLFSKGKDFVYNIQGISDDSQISETVLPNALYTAAFAGLTSSLAYLVGNASNIDSNELGRQASHAMTLGIITGPMIIPMMDFYKESIQEKVSSTRKYFSKVAREKRVALATALTSLSLMTTAAIYNYTPDSTSYVRQEEGKVIYDSPLANKIVEGYYGLDLSLEGDLKRARESRQYNLQGDK